MAIDALFRWKTRDLHRRFHGAIPYGFALYMRPGLFELRRRR